MRVTLITAQYPPATVPCGIGDYTLCLRRELESLGHTCLIITSDRSRSAEANVYPLARDWGLTDVWAIWRMLRREQPDAVLVQYTPEHYGYGLSFKLLPLLVRWLRPRMPLVTTFHTLVGGRWVAKFYAALLAAGSHGVISIHAELTELFRRRLPWWADKLREIPIGANIPRPDVDAAEARRRLHQRLGLSAETPLLGTFGFPAPSKGLETLIQAMRQLTGSLAAHLLCVGETRDGDRSYRAELESLARHVGVADRIHWVGGVAAQEASNLLAGVDAYVVPYDEGASLRRGTLMAGFRVGVPMITTTPRYPDPALKVGDTILAVPPCAPAALADCIETCLGDAGLRERLRQGAFSVGSRFDWTMIAAAHMEFFQDIRKQEGWHA